MAKVHNLPFEELTFLRLELKPCLSQFSENCLQPLQSFPLGLQQRLLCHLVNDVATQLKLACPTACTCLFKVRPGVLI